MLRLYHKFGKDLPDADWNIDSRDGDHNYIKENNGVWSLQTVDGATTVPFPDFTVFSYPESVWYNRGENSRSHSFLLKIYEKILEKYPF